MLEACDELSYPVFIVTKSDLAARDKDVLSSLAKRNLTAVNFNHTSQSQTSKKNGTTRTIQPEKIRSHKNLNTNRSTLQPLFIPNIPNIIRQPSKHYLKKASQSGANAVDPYF
jgi:DNA repair photolyase